MIEYDCPTCQIPLRIPKSVMGQSGTCKHCGQHFALPSLWRYRVARAWAYTRKNAWPATSRILWRIANFNSRTPPRPTWRDDPMTERQREFLLDLGAEEHQIEGFSKGQATDMISILKGEPVGQSNRELIEAQKETARAVKKASQTNQNCLGCLILVLLLLFAPVWIPLLVAALAVIGLAG